MATIIISKVTDNRLLLNSKSGNENLPDLNKTDKVQDLYLKTKYMVFAVLLDIFCTNYLQK